MLITLCYVYMWVRFHKCYSVLIRDSLRRLKSSGFSFSICSGRATGPRPASSSPSPGDSVFLQLGDKAVYVTQPQVCDDLSKWTLLLESSLVCAPQIENISFIIEATGQRTGCRSPYTAKKKVLKWSDCCLPLACSPGQPFRAVAQASVDDFSRLGVAFIEDRLQLDNGLMPSKIVPVLLQESTISELLEKQGPQTQKTETLLRPSTTQSKRGLTASLLQLPDDHKHLVCRKGSLLALETKRKLEERRGSEPLCSTNNLGVVGDCEDQSLGHHHHMDGHGHHLHLSSCHECLELENSTILSVKYASVENIPDLPDDSVMGSEFQDETLDELDNDANGFCDQSGRNNFNSKLPNVLVYTGGCQERFQTVCQLLSECINIENNTIYHLLPQQALSDPWLENTRLLVLAEQENLTPQLQTRFLTYLSQGGRVLGLASSLCPAGLCLQARERQHGLVSKLIFTREDSTEMELSVLATDRVYIRDSRGGGEVELWGELKGDISLQREMVIVRVTHGVDGGEAVLCQVHLEIAPESQNLKLEAFDELKVSNALRYDVLTEILTSLGLSCELNQTPSPSPLHLLAVSQEAKASFLKWLRTRADENGLITLSKVPLKMVSSSELQDGPLSPKGSLALVTDSSNSQSLAQFINTYSKNLKTSLLGHTLLYAEVVTSTMDLLEGLNIRLPEDVGLIAVAAQQSHGRGRGRNAWLSPLGCAMFTLRVQVELGSRLGRRIPFLQHLAALAVVEAVRTLPGYQDIDLRVKWPNDIYYSNLMKLGGVLVTSTVMGSMFHLLIGCGFNVTNSNPTMCVNDLIKQYNTEHQCSLQPLSCAQLIGRSVSCLEALISSFQQEGPDAVLPTYYSRWLHSGTRVRLWCEDGPEAEVVGLDHNGFLQVYNKEHGVVSVEPDGNSFDMLKNLVIMKQH